MDTLSPSDLFSPSKAALHRAQAQDWAFIETWLAAHYRNRAIPPFERNDDTLKALLALAAANEKAEEETGIVNRAEREALIELEEDENNLPDTTVLVLTALKDALPAPAQSALSTLSRASVLLSTDTADTESLAHALVHLTTTSSNLEQRLAYIHTLHANLERQLAETQHTLDSVKTEPEFNVPRDLPGKTAEYTRQTKHLRSKLAEYTARLAALAESDVVGGSEVLSSEGIAGIVRAEEEIESLAEQVVSLEAQLEAFKGLPADRDAAKQKIKTLESQVVRLRAKRDKLFEDMVG
ncbi:hypothetical protein EJ05DRAFT_379667 [Pseudovirgaria hyperparasitica]|uniref:HAUS augmin-like complex subunit 1 n=1 Tax=Pseudovirgaria hyperparasitica TaxID=470096 RepID=A0A6A6W5G2_9PEZI|nr:uncharacterized protein EJ05DRAFT_379667 [Pseudovirgaria hyperparasitica]KAF2758168.1 hypothetical protein EJ05DRAFT_379667 [Pseudovirgaria hyperparasitica]